jgi:FkbM family methyltransferase
MLDYMARACYMMNFRGKARLFNLIGPRSGVKYCKRVGVDFELDLDDFIQRQIYFGTLEPFESGLVRDYLHPGMTFVDVGANVGYFSALAARLVGERGRVIAFEPSPYAFERLRSMVNRNHLTQVQSLRLALGEQAGESSIYLGEGSRNHTPTMIPTENSVVTKINVQTLDSAVETLRLARIDLIKIDVEGFEPHVLAGATELLQAGRIRAIVCEMNEHWLRRAGSSPEQLKRTILDAGLVEIASTKQDPQAPNRFFRLP